MADLPFDTNVVSELRRTRPNGAVPKWLESVSDADLNLSAVTSARRPCGRGWTPGYVVAGEAQLEESGLLANPMEA